MHDIRQSMDEKIASWRQSMSAQFGTEPLGDDPQVQLVTDAGRTILLSPAPAQGGLYFTALLGLLPNDGGRTAEAVLTRNLFHRSVSGGYFAVEPEERRLCFQYYWEAFVLRDFDAFLRVLEDFGALVESLDVELSRPAPVPSPTEAVADGDRSFIRI